jgi:hypothetical protein
MMVISKDIVLARIRVRAEAEAGYLAGEFVRAASEQREAILAALEFEKQLAEDCTFCLAGGGPEGL